VTEAAAVAEAHAPARPWKRALALVTVISLLNSMATMTVLPVLPNLLKSFTHGSTSEAAQFVGWFTATFACVQFFAAPLLGSLSDAFGRRTVILLSALGLAADYMFMALAPSVGWLFVGRVIAGVTSASAGAVNAYIADSIPAEERAGAFGWTGAAMSSGFLLGPALGGVLGAINLRLPFWVSAGLCLASVLYGLFILPESLPPERRSPFRFRTANPWGALQFLAERPLIVGLVAVLWMMTVAAQCLPPTIVLYTEQRYRWPISLASFYLTYAGIGHLLVQSLVVRRFVARFGERAAAITGFASTAVGFLIYATAPSGLVFPLGMPFYALAGLVGPAVQSRLTRLVARTEQGRLQGTNASLASLAQMFAPLMFTQVFAWAIRPGSTAPPGLHIYLAAIILALGALLAARNMRAASAEAAPAGEAA
jgi:DHA1 family tetracycline resistance protein-like MFS transporter